MLEKPHTTWGWPLLMAYIRLPLILVGNGAIILAFKLAGYPVEISTGAAWSTLSVTVANIVCLGLLLWRARVEGLQLGNIVGFRRRRLLGDLAEGILWSMVLYALMMSGSLATVLAIQGFTGQTFEQLYLEQVLLSIGNSG